MPKYKLKCFKCGDLFNEPIDVFKDKDNFPVCANCLIEFLQLDWEYNFTEHIFNKIKDTFNRNYMRWKRWFYKNHVLCEGEGHEEEYSHYYEHKDNITVIDGKKYCMYCMDVKRDEI